MGSKVYAGLDQESAAETRPAAVSIQSEPGPISVRSMPMVLSAGPSGSGKTQ